MTLPKNQPEPGPERRVDTWVDARRRKLKISQDAVAMHYFDLPVADVRHQ
jgi:hypothetical protein